MDTPHDMVFVRFKDEDAFLTTALILLRAGQVFVVSPNHAQIGMSEKAAGILGLM